MSAAKTKEDLSSNKCKNHNGVPWYSKCAINLTAHWIYEGLLWRPKSFQAININGSDYQTPRLKTQKQNNTSSTNTAKTRQQMFNSRNTVNTHSHSKHIQAGADDNVCN